MITKANFSSKIFLDDVGTFRSDIRIRAKCFHNLCGYGIYFKGKETEPVALGNFIESIIETRRPAATGQKRGQ